MKKTLKPLNFLVFAFLFISYYSAFSQNKSWEKKFEYSKAFIENKGQFPFMLNAKTKKDGILFAVDQGPVKIYFTKNGVNFNYIKSLKKSQKGIYKGITTKEEWAESDNKDGKRRPYKQDEVSFIWENSNPNVEIISEDPNSDYYSYSFKESKEDKNANFIRGYQKLIYKNLYPNIDVEYKFNESEGIKYALILHPGADASKIKMTYSDPIRLSENGDLHIPTIFGDIIDHAPQTFYSDNSSLPINSRFSISGNSVGFVLDSYDNSKSITIDPWVVSPNFSTSTAVWEVETDASGNVYVIGGETPMQLRKFDIAGNPLWTYITPWDTSNVWLGTLATDNLGNSYITSGVSPQIKKINPAGGVVWSSNGPNGSCEYWSITFNCDKTKLIVGGTYVPFIISFDFSSAIYDIDINNGSVLNFVTFDTVSIMGIGTFPIEVRSISSSKNAKYIFLTHKNVGAINQNIGACPNDQPVYELDNGHNLSYKCEDYLPETQNGGGLKALVANDQFFYTHSGNQIHKRSLSNGSLISSVSIPSGTSTTDIFGDIYVSNSGLAVDNCGNVYAGSTNQVIKFDANLNILSQAAVPFCVYDVSVNTNGEVIAVGAQNNNQSVNRNGKIQSLSMGACSQYSLVCCDANICHADTVCTSDPSFNLIATTPGGTWSGTGITNTSLGTFNPSVAGPGTFWVHYTLACGSDSTQITVNACATLFACQETNGNITVSNGTGPYTWEQYNPAVVTNITNAATCTACGGTWFFGTCLSGMIPITSCTTPAYWSVFATGSTITPSGVWPIRVTDASSNTITIANLASLPMCSSCPTLTVTASNIVNVICAGGTTGSFSATTSGGTGPYDYSLMLGATPIASFTNVAGSQSFTGLAAGTYTLNVLDNNGCPGTATITILPGITVTVTVNNPTICPGTSAVLTATGGTTYAWSDGSTTNPTTVIPGSTTSFTVTGTTSGCSGTAIATVTVSPSLNITVNDTTICNGASAILTANGGTTYAWSNGSTTNPTTVSPGSTTSYTVTGTSSGCTGTAISTVTVSPGLIVTVNNPTICTGSSAILTANGGTTYTWSNGSTTNPTTVSPGSTTSYTVTGTSSGCSGTAVSIVTVSPSLNITVNSPTICPGTSAILTANGGTTYAWSDGSTTNPTTVNPGSTTSYTVTGTSSGCTGTAIATVTVSTTLNITVNSPSICNGGSAILTANGATNYNWSNGSTTNPTTVSPGSTTTYTVTGTSSGCSGTSTAVVTVNSVPVALINGNTTICSGSPTVLTASGGTTYLWSNAATTAIITVSPTIGTTYIVTVSNGGCSSTASISINAMPIPIATVTPNFVTIHAGDVVVLTATGGGNYSWSPTDDLSCSTCPNPTASPTVNTLYCVTVSDSLNCVDTACASIHLEILCGEVFVPSAFSPNNDNSNDLFFVYGNCIATLNFAIFDRWGEKVFETTDIANGWDGKYKGQLMNSQVFVYYFNATLLNGDKIEKQGNITLFR